MALADLGLYEPPRRLVDEVLSRRVVVLVGEPGFGKSTELDQLVMQAEARGLACQRIDLRGYGEGRLLAALHEGPAVRAATQSAEALLMLDGLDESPLAIGHLADVLSQAIEELPPGVHVLMTCRTAAWPNALESDLRARAPDLQVVELLPLTRDQVDHLAGAAGLDPDMFRQAVTAAGVEDLTRTPILLKLLLGESLRQGEGELRLSGSRTELFARACHELAREPNEYRRDGDAAPDPDEVLSVASYLAVLGVLSTATAFDTGDSQTGLTHDLATRRCVPATIQRWSAAAGVTTDPILVRERHIDRALGTALFVGRGEHRFWFVHQALGEYLAARHLVKSGIPSARIRSLLGGRYGMVAPQVQAVAAWLVALRPVDYRWLIEEDPAAFVRSGGELADPAYREVLCDALFALASRHELTHLYDLDLRQIGHPGLADTATRYLSDREAAWEVRTLALLAARANDLRQLAGGMTSLALDKTEPSDLRYVAASTALALDGNTAAPQLAQLVASGDTDPEVDPDDQLMGVGLAAALHAGQPLGAVLQHLRRPRRRNLIGRYRRLLTQELPAAVADRARPVSDIVDALAWAESVETVSSPASALVEAAGHVLDATVLAAVSRSEEDSRLGPAAAKFLLNRLHQRHQVLWERDSRAHFTMGERHLLLRTVIPATSNEADRYVMWLAVHDLAQPDDLQLLVDWFHAAATPTEAEAWALCAGMVFDPARPEHSQIADSAGPGSDLHRQAFAPALEHDTGRDADTTPDARSLSAAELRKWISEAFALAPGEAFLQLCFRLQFQPDTPDPQLGLALEVAELPGWALLDVAQRRRAADLAEKYLRVADVDPTADIGTNRLTWGVIAGLRAFVLLYYSLDRLVRLTPERWALWVPALVDAPLATGEEKLLRLALVQGRQHANTAFVNTVRMLVTRDETAYLTLHRVAGALDASDVAWLAELATDQATPVSTASEAFRQVLRLAPAQGQQFLAHQLSTAGSPALTQAFTVSALLADPVAVWPVVWPAIRDDDQFAERVLLDTAQSQLFDHAALPEQDVTELWKLMNRLFPPRDDPVVSDIVHRVTPRETAGHVRDRLLPSLAQRGTDAADAALTSLAGEHPTEDWMVRLCAHARRALVRSQWQAAQAEDLAALISAPHKALVRTSADLLEVVLEVLDKVQKRLTGGPYPEATMLWNHGKGCKGDGDDNCHPRSEDDISDHIARETRDLLGDCVINREVQGVWLR